MTRTIKVLYPPQDGSPVRDEPVKCEICEKEAIIALEAVKVKWGVTLATCPCGGAMFANIAKYRVGLAVRGPGMHETKIGQKLKRERTKKNELLGKTQWENHAPLNVGEGRKARNPTPGGPLDPKSKFHKKVGRKK